MVTAPRARSRGAASCAKPLGESPKGGGQPADARASSLRKGALLAVAGRAHYGAAGGAGQVVRSQRLRALGWCHPQGSPGGRCQSHEEALSPHHRRTATRMVKPGELAERGLHVADCHPVPPASGETMPMALIAPLPAGHAPALVAKTSCRIRSLCATAVVQRRCRSRCMSRSMAARYVLGSWRALYASMRHRGRCACAPSAPMRKLSEPISSSRRAGATSPRTASSCRARCAACRPSRQAGSRSCRRCPARGPC